MIGGGVGVGGAVIGFASLFSFLFFFWWVSSNVILNLNVWTRPREKSLMLCFPLCYRSRLGLHTRNKVMLSYYPIDWSGQSRVSNLDCPNPVD